MVKCTKCLGKVWCWGWWLSVQSVWVRFGVGGGGVWTGIQSVHSLCSYRIPHALSTQCNVCPWMLHRDSKKNELHNNSIRLLSLSVS